MRFILIGAAVALVGCGSSSQIQSTSHSADLSLGNSETRFAAANTNLGNGSTVTLYNTDFETPRRIVHPTEISSMTSEAPREVLEAQAKIAAETLYPGMELKQVDFQKGDRFVYVTFEQMHLGDEVYGARLVMRLTPQGEWATASATVVSPELLNGVQTNRALKISSGDYLKEAHAIMSEKSVYFPKRDVSGKMKVYAARQFDLFSLETQVEAQIWVDEATLLPLAAVSPLSKLEEDAGVQFHGSVLPNAPDDQPIDIPFPNLAVALTNGTKLLTDENGKIDIKKLLGDQVKVSLKNDFVEVINNDRKQRSFDTNIANGAVSLDDGPAIEDRNVFHYIMVARKFLHEKLHYDGMDYQITAFTNYGAMGKTKSTMDNAFFMPAGRFLAFGAGKTYLKNTAKARDVIIHEFGHAVTDRIYGQVVNYEFNAMNEAFSDYFAATITNDPQIGEGEMRPAWVDMTKHEFLRTVENNYHYPEDFDGVKFHDDGQMFSGALWDIRKALGQEVADKMIHEARLAQAKTIVEFMTELLAIDEDADDHDWRTPSKHHREIAQAFFRHGLFSNVSFTQKQEDLTTPWHSEDCWGVPREADAQR